MESGDPRRLYTALSLLVSTAADGEEAWGLVGFGALEPMTADGPPVPADGVFGRSLAELRESAFELCRLYACAAAVEAGGAGPGRLEIMSTPRFLRHTAGARLVVV